MVGEAEMNFREIKYLLFGNPKPFRMTREKIDFKEEELTTLQNIADVIEQDEGKGLYEIYRSHALKPYVDYIRTYHQVGKGNQNASFDLVNTTEQTLLNQEKLPLTVGIVADTFLYDALKGACNLIYINEKHKDEHYDFVIIASTWKGIDGYWEGNTNVHSEKYEELKRLVKNFQDRAIPIVFFNKEDPINFEVFQSHAQWFEHVITTEQDFVLAYKEKLGIAKVKQMRFPINPRIHHPIASSRDVADKKIVFAGSWLDKYEERAADIQTILEGVIQNNWDLTIYDRNLWTNKKKYQFPAAFLPYIAAPLNHMNTMKMHRAYPFAINVNTIKYSQTMCANRIFELQGMGVFMLSNYNTFVNAHFPQVQMVFEPQDVKKINRLDSVLIKRAQSIGIQKVMLSTAHQLKWLNDVSQFIGLSSQSSNLPELTVVIEEADTKAMEMFEAQTYEWKTCVSSTDDIHTDYYTFFSSDFNYDPEYLSDFAAAFMYTDVRFITKRTEGYRWVSGYDSRYLTAFNQQHDNNQRGFALDITFVDSQNQIEAVPPVKPELSVIVPVHNNGTHLEHKCLRSIISHPLFPKLEVILVDDGSTDRYTSNLMKMYSQWYKNIEVIHLDEASGSASTPRNIGIDYAKSDLITFLDPDNEWIGEGIDRLFEEITQNDEIDAVIGNMLKVDQTETKKHDYYQQFVHVVHADMTRQTHQFLHDMKLKTASIQALIVRKSLLKKHQIKMVPGALGQDSLFFLTMIHHAQAIKVVDATVHVYYAGIANSMTNQISEQFFRKYYLVEREKVKFLKQHGYLSTYMNHRFNYYVKHWYISRINRTTEKDPNVLKAFLAIIDLYQHFDRPYDAELVDEIEMMKNEVKEWGIY